MIERLRELLDQRIVVLDGAWGVLLQGQGLTAADYRGERFRDHPRDVAGDPDLLNLTRPDLIGRIHRDYLAAGADITTTNTFTATSIGQADYGLEVRVVDAEHDVRPRDVEQVGVARDVARVIAEALAAIRLLAAHLALDEHAPGAVEDGDPLVQQRSQSLRDAHRPPTKTASA